MNLMNPFDIGIVIVLAFCLIRGLFRGFVKELFSLIGVLVGFYGAGTFYPVGAGLLSRYVRQVPYPHVFAFFIIFFLIFILINLLGTGIKHLLRVDFLRWMDRFCGMVFGAFKGVLITSVLLMAITAFLPGSLPLIKSSKLCPKVYLMTEQMINLVPKEMKKQFAAKVEEYKQAWKKNP